MGACGNRVHRLAMVMQFRSGSPARCAASMGTVSSRPAGGSRGGLLPVVHRLHQPRCETARNERNSVDAGCGFDSERARHSPLFRFATTPALLLPPVRKHNSDGVQLLPMLQLQTESQLPAVSACDRSQRCLLPVLWNIRANANEGCANHSGEKLNIQSEFTRCVDLSKAPHVRFNSRIHANRGERA